MQKTITNDKEIHQIEVYLSLDQTRFPDCYNIHFDIEQECKQTEVSLFIIDIFVENAIEHAFHNHKTGDNVDVAVIIPVLTPILLGA